MRFNGAPLIFSIPDGKVIALESVKYPGCNLGVEPDGSGTENHGLFVQYLYSVVSWNEWVRACTAIEKPAVWSAGSFFPLFSVISKASCNNFMLCTVLPLLSASVHNTMAFAFDPGHVLHSHNVMHLQYSHVILVSSIWVEQWVKEIRGWEG